MGHAAYMRGNRGISAQFCRDRGCSGCVRCRPDGAKPTPRPPEWGDKTRALAFRWAKGCAQWCADTGRQMDVESLAAAVVANVRCGRATALWAAGAALAPNPTAPPDPPQPERTP